MDYNKYSKDVHTIIDNLSKEESNHIGNGYWVDSDHIIYRKVEYMNNKPVGFIDVYSLPKFKRYGLIIIAVSKDARGKGVGKKLVNSAIQICKNNKDIDKLRWLADSDNTASINMAKSLGFKLNNDKKDKKEFIYDLRGDENMSDLYENINEYASTVAAVGLHLISVLRENRYCKEFNNYAKQRCGDELILMSDLTHKRIASSIDGLLKKNWTINHPTELVDFLQKYDNELYNKYKDKNIIFIDQYSLKNDKPGNIFFVSISVFNPFNHRYKLSLNYNRGIEPVEYKYIPINSISKKYSAYYIIGSLYSVDRNIKDILNKINDAYRFGIRSNETDFENIVESKYPQVKEFKKSFYDSLKNNKSKKTDDKSTTNTKDKNKTSKETNVNESTLPSKERNKLDDDVFGIPSLRKYPLNDKAHVLAAIRMFNRVDRKHEKELAHNIIVAMEKYKISKDIIGPKNRLQSYI